MLGQRRRRWANIHLTLDQRLVFAVMFTTQMRIQELTDGGGGGRFLQELRDTTAGT